MTFLHDRVYVMFKDGLRMTPNLYLTCLFLLSSINSYTMGNSLSVLGSSLVHGVKTRCERSSVTTGLELEFILSITQAEVPQRDSHHSVITDMYQIFDMS